MDSPGADSSTQLPKFEKEDLSGVFPAVALGTEMPFELPNAGTLSAKLESSGPAIDPMIEIRFGTQVIYSLLANTDPSLTLSEDGTQLTFKKLVLPGTLGVHRLVVFAKDDQGGTIEGSYKIKAAKGKARLVEVGR